MISIVTTYSNIRLSTAVAKNYAKWKRFHATKDLEDKLHFGGHALVMMEQMERSLKKASKQGQGRLGSMPIGASLLHQLDILDAMIVLSCKQSDC